MPKCHCAWVIVLALTFGCQGRPTDSLDVSYQRLREIPHHGWESLAQKRIFFGHQSVGQNIISGLSRVLAISPEVRLNIRETAAAQDFEAPVFAHARIGQNVDPKGKINHFRQLLRSGIGRTADVAFFKLCFVDIDRTTKVEALIDYYDQTLAGLREEFPNLIIIPVTVPLTTAAPGLKAKIKRILGRGTTMKADNIKRQAFNDAMRCKYGRELWDLADAEATTASGTKATFHDRGRLFFMLNPDYTTDGGHLNDAGSQALAVDLLLRLASLDSDEFHLPEWP